MRCSHSLLACPQRSSASLATVVMSRLARARDDAILQPAAFTPIGATLLAVIKAAVLQLAVSVGGADTSFNEQSATTLFNLSASTIATQRLYDGGFSLPSKLPWPRARVLVNAILESLSAVRATESSAPASARYY
jgi:hypothetical protein